MRSDRILLFDIEVSRDIVEGYGNKWEFKVVKTVRHQELMCFAYKWLGSNKIDYVSRHDYKTYKEFVESLHSVLDEADVVIAHNGNKFDVKMSNRFFIKEGFGPTSPYKSIDTLQVARGTFKFQSNSLQDLGDYLGIGVKKKIGYADLEDDFLNNPSRKVTKLMREYAIQDVVLLERLYLLLRPYIKNHTNLGDLSGERGICPKCGSAKLEKRGVKYQKQTYQCKDCGGWCNDSSKKLSGRIVNG